MDRPFATRLLAPLLLLCLASAAAAQTQQGISMQRFAIVITVQPDASYQINVTTEIGMGTGDGARNFGQLPIPYSPSLETMEIVSAETRKPDGTTRKVALDAIQDRLMPAALNAASFDDRHMKILVFPDVSSGDTLAATVRRRSLRSYFPGFFTFGAELSRNIDWNNVDLTISAPAEMPLASEIHELVFDNSVKDGRAIYHVHADALRASSDVRTLADGDTAPRFYFSSFKDWNEFAQVYADLALPKTAVTLPIQKLADEIIKGITDRREQARKLHDWVATNIRYVNVVLGIGGFEPHAAAEIAERRYGDCKDHTVLFHALLGAKGIQAEMVLINLSNFYTVAEVAHLGGFDHMISYLPEFDLYDDTTNSAAAFGGLAFQEYGKPVLHVASAGTSMRRTPLLAADGTDIELRTTAFLTPSGVLHGTTTSKAHGPFAWLLRSAARGYMNERIPAAVALLKRRGSLGTGGFDRVDAMTLADDMSVSGYFILDAQNDFLTGEAFAPPTGLRVIARPGDFLLGQLFDRPLQPSQSMPCWSGRQVEDLSVQLPEGRRLQRLPKSVTAQAEGVAFTSKWLMDGQIVRVRRELVSSMTTAVCGPAQRAAMAPALEIIRSELNRRISLADE